MLVVALRAWVDNTLNTRFRIGSMNKMFTAVATLQLVERGKPSLDDTIGKILPDYQNANVASKVKVRHLLSHTGGTGDIFGPKFEAHRLELKTLQTNQKWRWLGIHGCRCDDGVWRSGSQH